MDNKRSVFRVYVKVNGIRKRERKVKHHSDFIAMLDVQPDAAKMSELETIARGHIQTNFKTTAGEFTVTAQHNTVETFDGIDFMQRLLFGDKLDVTQVHIL